MPANGPLAFLPVLTKARELDSRMLFAAVLACRGYRVLIGGRGTINILAANSRNGLYLCPLLSPRDTGIVSRLRDRGHVIIGWHEEGLVYPMPDWYFKNRLSGATAKLVHAIVMWGQRSADDLKHAWPDLTTPIFPLGNPRIDVLREPFRRIYEPAAAGLSERFGRYLLVNTNFDLVNHVDGPDSLIRSLRTWPWTDAANDLPKLEQWGAYRRTMFDAFRKGLPRLHALLPDMQIVVRPHPSENVAPWKALEKAHSRIVVAEPASTVIPWILGAEAVLHNSCTTAVESFVLDRPAIAFIEPSADGAMESQLPNWLSLPAHSWQETAETVRRIAERGRWKTDSQQRIADRHLALASNGTSCERIADLARELGAEKKAGELAVVRSIAAGPPLLLEQAKPYVKQLVSPFRRQLIDGRRRFDGLNACEMEGPLVSIGAVLGRQFRIRPYAPDTCILTAADAC